MVSALRKAARNGTMLPFVISYGGRVAGQLDVSNVVHGVLRSCTVGYWVDAAGCRARHCDDGACSSD
jgi:ribosomal-protein-alanine N-acetyltransferase